MRCFVVAGFLLTSASRGPSAIAEPLVSIRVNGSLLAGKSVIRKNGSKFSVRRILMAKCSIKRSGVLSK